MLRRFPQRALLAAIAAAHVGYTFDLPVAGNLPAAADATGVGADMQVGDGSVRPFDGAVVATDTGGDGKADLGVDGLPDLAPIEIVPTDARRFRTAR